MDLLVGQSVFPIDQSSVTCDGQYRKHEIEAQSSFYDGLHDVKFDAKRKRLLLLLLPGTFIYHIRRIFRTS